MPELIRTVVSRVRTYLKDRRQAPRLAIRLPLTVSLHQRMNANGPHQTQALKGYTRDMSMNGLALLLPRVHLNGHHLAAEGRELQIQIDLPTGPISIRIMPLRYEQLEAAESSCGYLIGAKIVEMSDADRCRYAEFLADGLGKPHIH